LLRNCPVFDTGQFFFDITGYFSEIYRNLFDITGNNSVPGGALLVPEWVELVPGKVVLILICFDLLPGYEALS
jgi:hypothetical protein